MGFLMEHAGLTSPEAV
nr:hypothetical protein [Burkholderia pseudomallei]